MAASDSHKAEVQARPAGETGFTLVELLITILVLGILAAIAVPSYQDYVRQANRAEAKGILLETVQFLERNYTTNNCYHRTDGACSTTSAPVGLLPYSQSPKSGTAKYDITAVFNTDLAGTACTNATSTPAFGQCFVLSAAPTGSMAGDTCGTLTIDQTGQTGSAVDNATCWQR